MLAKNSVHEDVGPLYVKSLQESGAIEKSEFSIHMAGYVADYSTIDIGAPDTSKM
jgi:hypothetical protein